MITAVDLDALAARLSAARASGRLVDEFPLLDLADGYAVSARLGLGVQLGWKIGATSVGARAFLGVTEPIYGRLFAAWAGDEIAVPGDRAAEAEPEIVVRLGPDLQPEAAWAGTEIVRPSFAEPFALGPGAIVADNAASVGAWLAVPLPLAALDDPTLEVRLLIDGLVAGEGFGGAVEGGPLAQLAWLATALAGTPRGLRPGDLVATGAICRAIPVPRGTTLGIEVSGHGTASARLN